MFEVQLCAWLLMAFGLVLPEFMRLLFAVQAMC